MSGFAGHQLEQTGKGPTRGGHAATPHRPTAHHGGFRTDPQFAVHVGADHASDEDGRAREHVVLYLGALF